MQNNLYYLIWISKNIKDKNYSIDEGIKKIIKIKFEECFLLIQIFIKILMKNLKNK